MSVSAGEDGSWTWEIGGLRKRSGGTEIAYTVSEDAVKNYATQIAGNSKDGYTITNRLVDHGYAFTKGDNGSWTRGSMTTLDFTVNRSPDDGTAFSHFAGIRIDGRDVPKEAYEAQAGSVVIKLKPAYLEKLKDGSHTIVANFNDGSAQARFAIEAAPASNVPDSANRKMPNTSDPLFGSAPLFLLAAGAVLCLAVAVRRRVK